VATADGEVGVDVNADPPQAQMITAQLIAAASTTHLEAMSAAELNTVVTPDAQAFVGRFRACYDFSCLYSDLETALHYVALLGSSAGW
jgi:hypothetical protein